MITFEEAKQVALARVLPGCALMESRTMEKPYGWYFYQQSLEYIKTGDYRHALMGSFGFIVERTIGRVYDFGSAFPLEKWFANYERGFRSSRLDLSILTVADVEKTLSLLAPLTASRPAPEEMRWQVPRSYARDELREMLSRLPCTLTNLSLWGDVRIFDEIDTSGCCRYELHEHVPEKVASRFPRWRSYRIGEEWPAIKASLSIGQAITGIVVAREIFVGVWLDIGVPFPAVLFAHDLREWEEGYVAAERFPLEGQAIDGRIGRLGDHGEITITQRHLQ
jgi:hypothetical protein